TTCQPIQRVSARPEYPTLNYFHVAVSDGSDERNGCYLAAVIMGSSCNLIQGERAAWGRPVSRWRNSRSPTRYNVHSCAELIFLCSLPTACKACISTTASYVSCLPIRKRDRGGGRCIARCIRAWIPPRLRSQG